MIPRFDLASHRPRIARAQIDELRERLFGDGPPRSAPEIPGYTLDEELGRGAFGRVYRAFDARFQRRVALKLLPVDSRRALVRIEREAHALARVSHPNVVQVYDKGPTADGGYFLALEYVEGRSLDHWLADRHRSIPEILRCFVQVAEGLAEAHRAELVHRDLKPANVIVGKDGRVRLIDFGLARTADPPGRLGPHPLPTWAPVPRLSGVGGQHSCASERPAATDRDPTVTAPRVGSLRSTVPDGGQSCGEPQSQLDLPLTADGLFVGTPYYAAPEQHMGAADERSDQFSFCVALYEALYGRRPFHLDGQRGGGAQLLGQRPAFPRGKRVPRWVVRLLRTGLALDPARRHPSMTAIARRIRHRLEVHPARMRWLGFAGAAALTTAAITVSAMPTERERIEACVEQRSAAPEGWAEAVAAVRARSPALADELRGLDRAWQDEHAQVCSETDAARRDAIDACLAGSRGAIDELGGWLAGLDDAGWQRLLAHPGARPLADLIDTLPSLGRCGDERATGGLEGAREVWSMLLHARQLELAGSIDEAETATARASERAQLLGLPRLRVAAEVRRATLDIARERPWSMPEMLDLVVTAHQAGLAEVATDLLALALVNNAAGDLPLGGTLPTMRYRRIAEDLAAIRSRADLPERQRGWLALAEGHASYLDADYPHALERFANAYQTLRLSESDAVTSEIQLIRALAMFQADQHDEVAAVALDALEGRKRALGARHPMTAEASRAVGEILVGLGRHDEAMDLYRAADDVFAELGRDIDRAVVHSEIAEVRYRQAVLAFTRFYEAKGRGEDTDPILADFEAYRGQALDEQLLVEQLVEPFVPPLDDLTVVPPRPRDLARLHARAIRIYGYSSTCWDELVAASRRLERICAELDVREYSCARGRTLWLRMLEQKTSAKIKDGPCRPVASDTSP